MGENNGKWNNWQRINFQNIQAAHPTQCHKNPIKKTETDISPKKTYRWLTKTWKDAQHHSSEKCKSRPQWGTISHQSEWQRSKSLQAINAGEGVEKREPSYTAGGDVNWYSHYGRLYGHSLKTRNKTTIWPSNPTLRHILWGNRNWKRHMYPIVHYSTIYNSYNMEAT